jgi:hypothetical protein
MASTDESGVALSEFHIDAGAMDALLAINGSPAELRIATPCACWDARTGQPDPGCMRCYPLGFIYDAPVTESVHGPNRRPRRRYNPEGELDEGEVTFTFRRGVVPTFGTRIAMLNATVVVTDTLTKGVEDTIRWSHVLAVEAGHYTRRVPPTGPDYDVETVPLVLAGPTPDLVVVGRDITWVNVSIPDGTRYSLRFRTRPEYVAWEVRDRTEGGQVMPYLATAKRLDFLLHPRGTKEASY